jgi:pseudouridine kinase
MKPQVTVIGTIFVDCKGFAKQRYHAAGRNLGDIKFVHGGVGRNVAENLAHLGIGTTFISSIDQSAIGKEVLTRLKAAEIDTTYVSIAESQGMGMWLAILDESGDLAGSISQMPNLNLLASTLRAHGRTIIPQSTHVVLELDLNAQITQNVLALAAEYRKPVYGIPGNLAVILNHRHVLQDLDCFICNNIEAERLIAKPFAHHDFPQMQKDLRLFVRDTGLKSMVITLGSQGSIYYDLPTDEAGYQPIFPVTPVDSCGAGDAFFSGTVMGLVRGHHLREAVVYGTKLAAWTIQSAENTCLELTSKLANDELVAHPI